MLRQNVHIRNTDIKGNTLEYIYLSSIFDKYDPKREFSLFYRVFEEIVL